MKNKVMLVIGGLLAVMMIFGAVAVTQAYAQEGTPTTPTDAQAGGLPHHGRGLSQAELEAAAKVLGMTADELSSALEEGKSLETLAADAGVDLQDVQDAIDAVQQEELRTQIETAVSDGTISQEKGDWLLEGLDKGFLDDGHGFGIGLDRGGPDGQRGDMPLNDEAIAAAAKVLGVTTDEVTQAIESGTGLQKLAEQAGVDFSTVMDAIRQVMPAPHGRPSTNP